MTFITQRIDEHAHVSGVYPASDAQRPESASIFFVCDGSTLQFYGTPDELAAAALALLTAAQSLAHRANAATP